MKLRPVGFATLALLALVTSSPASAEAGGCVPRVAIIDLSTTSPSRNKRDEQLAGVQQELIHALDLAMIPALNATGGSQHVEMPKPPSKRLLGSLRRLMRTVREPVRLPRWFPARAALRELRKTTGDTIDTVVLLEVGSDLRAPIVQLVVVGIYAHSVELVLRERTGWSQESTKPAAELVAWAASQTWCDDS